MIRILCLRLALWCGVIGRECWSENRCGPIRAWRICAAVHPWDGR